MQLIGSIDTETGKASLCDKFATPSGVTELPADFRFTDISVAKPDRPPQTTRIGTQEIKARTRAAMARNLKSIYDIRHICKGQTAIICGGGPSLTDDLGTLRKLYNRGYKIIATNKTHDFLVRKNFIPWAVVLLDPMPHVADYVKLATAKTKAFIAGQCHSSVFDALKHADVYLWHAGDNQDEEMMPVSLLKAEYSDRTWKVVGGGNTGGLRAIYVAQSVGFRKMHLFGFDSSMRGGSLYAYDKPRPSDAAEGPATMTMNGHSETFFTNEHMARQVENFQDMLKQIMLWNTHKVWEGIDDIIVHGTGMLPACAAGHGLHYDPEMNRKWAKETTHAAEVR